MGCGCLILVIGLGFPRFAMFLLWMFTDWFQGVFDNSLVPILGFIFLPYSTLWYSVIAHVWGGDWGFWQILFMVVAVGTDLGALGGASKQRRKSS